MPKTHSGTSRGPATARRRRRRRSGTVPVSFRNHSCLRATRLHHATTTAAGRQRSRVLRIDTHQSPWLSGLCARIQIGRRGFESRCHTWLLHLFFGAESRNKCTIMTLLKGGASIKGASIKEGAPNRPSADTRTDGRTQDRYDENPPVINSPR